MKIILGLGNPGRQYEDTRHNIGFAALDYLAKAWQADEWHEKGKFKALLAEISVGGGRLLLVKPTTFYNQSGEAARAVLDFYKRTSADLLVIHDELALPFGTIRTRTTGSDAGNNGVKSLISQVGPDFARIRLGIANEHSPRQDAVDFVLGKLLPAEQALLPNLLEATRTFVEDFVHENKTFAHNSVTLAAPAQPPE